MNKFNDEVVKFLEGESYKRALKFSQKNNFEVVVESYNGSPLRERSDGVKKRVIFVELEGRDPYDIEDSKVLRVHVSE